MPENRGVEEAGKKEPEKGTTIVGNQIKGVTIIDKNTKTEPRTQVEIEDEIRKETGGPC